MGDTRPATKNLPRYTLRFQPSTIEHLGTKLYSTLPPVIGELVSNAWDADSPSVEVDLPDGAIRPDSEVVVRDHGSGMDPHEVQNCYLDIGRDRRLALGTGSSPGGRPLMGRKGLGKLSAFGVARELQIRTVRDGFAVCLRLDYDDMLTWRKSGEYPPTKVDELTGPAGDRNGTEIRLRRLKRKSPIDPDTIRTGLARRFSVFGPKFVLKVNGVAIKPEDRRIREKCAHSWGVADLQAGAVVDPAKGWAVTGWMGLTTESSQYDRGIDVFVRGKTAEQNTTFDLKTTHIQFARAYLVGEVHADFLDDQDDNIATARNSVIWESEAGQALSGWGKTAVSELLQKWAAIRREAKELRIRKLSDLDAWLQTRTPREQAVARRLVQELVDDEAVEPEAAATLVNVIKTNIEFVAFQDLVDQIEGGALDAATLLRLVADWQILEAREHLKLADGRLEVMEQLSKYIEGGALEVQHVQPLFEKNGWLVEPSWGQVEGQLSYSKMLREKFPERDGTPAEERRIDLLAYDANGGLHVVELKRPELALRREHLEQIERYVDWLRTQVGTGDGSPTSVRGLLVVGKMGSAADLRPKIERLRATDIRGETFRGLLVRARRVYGEVEERLKQIAPEYSKKARRERRKPAT